MTWLMDKNTHLNKPMNAKEFKKNYLGEFSVSDRDAELYLRVDKYFADTDDVSFRVSCEEARLLKVWCDDNGYSKGDLNRAKMIVNKHAG